MLDDYKDTQKIAYTILMNEIKNNVYSHAYMIEANNYHDPMGFAISLAKTLFCVDNIENNICELIDKNNFPELKIIDPEGLIIKKEEIENLQIEFSKKPLYSDKKIYIINNANRLNGPSANALLKFLEEPSQNIIAILITNNISEMMETIISRCQIITLQEEKIDFSKLQLIDKILFSINKKKDEIVQMFENESVDEIFYKCIDFVNYYEKHKLDTFIYLNNVWFNYYQTKDQFDIAFQIMLLYYTDIVRKKCKANINIFGEYESEINEIAEQNTISNLCQKIKTIMDLNKKIKENNNLNLVIDKLLIEFGRCDLIV